MTDFPFELDAFQRAAIEALDAGRSVVVCAPTGSGKTVVGEHAIHRALVEGRRVFYTTPLKALSNQKFRDFGATYGADRVGLLTGDVSLRGDAPVVVMTTEVFRNMLYGVGPDSAEARLDALAFVVLDECHYINDAGRGTVWEESVLCCPPEIQIVALSATIANPEELAGWMAAVHGPTDCIVTESRPVPLHYHRFAAEEIKGLVLGPAAPRGYHEPWIDAEDSRQIRSWEAEVEPTEVVAALQAREMLPAIYFLFSRAACEAALARCGGDGLLQPEEEARLAVRLVAALKETPSLRHHPHLPFLERGAAAHHAGLLPLWKALVERLFQAGLVKIVFATETLAAGINMPARATVIGAIEKPTGGRQATPRGLRPALRPLTPSEFHQMAGRAGRRGMDREGHVVIIEDPRRPTARAARLAAAGADPLLSRFAPSYSMVLNLLARRTPEEVERLLRDGFGAYLARARRGEVARATRVPLAGETPDEAPPAAIPPTSERAAAEGDSYRRFRALQAVLEEMGYVESNRPTEKGRTAAALRSPNELFFAEVIRSPLFATAAAVPLSAAVSALAAEQASPRRGVVGTPRRRPAPSPAALVLLVEIDARARDVRLAQQRHRVDLPTKPDLYAVGVIESWTAGASWEEVLAASEMEEGDLVYLIRTLIDLLRQIAAAPGIDARLRASAVSAVRLVDRDPVDQVI